MFSYYRMCSLTIECVLKTYGVVSVDGFVYACVHTRTDTRAYARALAYIQHTYICIHTYAYIHMHTFMHTYIKVHIYTILTVSGRTHPTNS